MTRQFERIGLIATTLIGLSYFSAPANSATLQSNLQKAIVDGNGNRVTQINKQTNLDLFFFDVNIDAENNQNETIVKSWIESEIFEFVDNFERDVLEFEQSITQEAELFGSNNQVTQISEQNIFDVFFLDPELKVAQGNVTNPFPNFDISQILSNRFTQILPNVKQNSIQEADTLGNNNKVKQENYQTVIDFFAIEIDFSTQLDNILVSKLEDNYDNFKDFNLDNFLEDFTINNSLTNLPNNFFQNNDPLIVENNNYSINQVSSTIPEPSSFVGLLAFGVLGIGAIRNR